MLNLNFLKVCRVKSLKSIFCFSFILEFFYFLKKKKKRKKITRHKNISTVTRRKKKKEKEGSRKKSVSHKLFHIHNILSS